MDEIPTEIIDAANAVLADILIEAASIVRESGCVMGIEEAVGLAVLSLATGASTSETTH
jgi:hypothetical protein